MTVSPEQERTAIALARNGLSDTQVITTLQNVYQLNDSAIGAVEAALDRAGSEIYTEQTQIITELGELKISGYRIWVILRTKFGERALSCKSVYNHLARLRSGDAVDAKTGACRYKAGLKEKTRHR